MKTILYIIQKEFLQIFRDRMMLPIIFVIPIFQLLILAHAATFEIKYVDLGIIDLDQSLASRALVRKFEASPFFRVKARSFSLDKLSEEMQNSRVEQILYIPANFNNELENKHPVKIQLITDAVDGAAAGIMNTYALSIVKDFNRNLLIQSKTLPLNIKSIETRTSYWYNPDLDYKTFMIPGILVLLVSIIGLFLSGLNIVKEKEIGTIEQLNVTPIKKHHFIIGKLTPFWFIAMFDLFFGLVLAKFVFHIPIVGSIGLIIFVASIYLVLVLGIGLFISTLADTQQQAMFIAWFFVVIFILLSGLFMPVENMPDWAQVINIINPIAYFIDFMRMVMLKGARFADVSYHIISITIYAILSISLATWRYKKVV
ncbi:MAG: ABC transporter permease [Bacteroidales bacterium]|nr:ABC transporter permease [Bacteroidales bacterium]